MGGETPQRPAGGQGVGDPAPAGGESLRQVADRLAQIFDALARERAGQAAILVSHGEVIAALVGALRGLPVAEWEELSLGKLRADSLAHLVLKSIGNDDLVRGRA